MVQITFPDSEKSTSDEDSLIKTYSKPSNDNNGVFYHVNCTENTGIGADKNKNIEKINDFLRRERNRIAAKKSRERKTILIRQYEYREKQLKDENLQLRVCIVRYDLILSLFMKLMGDFLDLRYTENFNDPVFLKKFVNDLKKIIGYDKLYLPEMSSVFNLPVSVTNQKIEMLLEKVKDFIRRSHDDWLFNID